MPDPKEHSPILGHRGVLFLDEISMFRTDVLESLRGPLEDRVVRVARSGGTIAFPCSFSLIAAMNPCPCGYLGDGRIACRCRPDRLERHAARLSGPLLDRFDFEVAMNRLTKRDLLGPPDGDNSATIRARVEAARAIQKQRYEDPLVTNASCSKRDLQSIAALSPEARSLLEHAIESLRLSGRALDRTLRVARTIADLAGGGDVTEDHLAASLSLRTTSPGERVAV